MHRTPLIVANWKMYKTAIEARDFISALKIEIGHPKRRIFIAPAFTAIESAVAAAQGSSIVIGAQNMHDELQGAFTGEISAGMLKSSGASFVILGHSERRHYFKETNAFIRRKLTLSLQERLTPILCIGENLEERENDTQEKVLESQLEECLKGLDAAQVSQVIIAYEPIWAIGTGKTATPEMAQAIHSFIRQWLERHFGKECSQKITLLYGGSVKPDNISSLMKEADIDGVLVGGASLEVGSFTQIINYQG